MLPEYDAISIALKRLTWFIQDFIEKLTTFLKEIKHSTIECFIFPKLISLFLNPPDNTYCIVGTSSQLYELLQTGQCFSKYLHPVYRSNPVELIPEWLSCYISWSYQDTVTPLSDSFILVYWSIFYPMLCSYIGIPTLYCGTGVTKKVSNHFWMTLCRSLDS